MSDLPKIWQHYQTEILTVEKAKTAMRYFPEAIQRAIAAEELVDRLNDTLVKTIEKCAPDHSELAGYKETVDLQRASIQELSRRVVNCKKEIDDLNNQKKYLYETSTKTIKTLLDRLSKMNEIVDILKIIGKDNMPIMLYEALQAMKEGEQ